jgi:serine/threonine-protein kinase
MGEIFLARLEGAAGFEKLYVIKRVLPHLADDARFRAMLIDEARIAAKMSHPNICQVYELGEDAGQLFIAMEYLEGVTLLPVLRRASRSKQPLSVGLVAAVLQQTCDALHYAHDLLERDGTRLQVVHRDVTPSNLFLTETGIIKVLDFGIAKAKDASAHTQDGTVKGKYAYMAPEQLRSEDADRRVDIFALGVVGFEMLALRRLFQRKTDYLTFRAVMELPIPNLRDFRPDLPKSVAEVFRRALERDPMNRFPTARQFAAALQDAIAGHSKSWTTSEVGDYIRQNFADELRKRGSALSTVIQSRETPTATGRTTMPVLEAIDAQPETGDHDDQDDFPSIDTGVHVLEQMARMDLATPTDIEARYRSDSDVLGSPLTELSAAPSGALSQPKGQALLQRNSGSVVVQAPSRRGVLWPILAVAVIGAGALALWFMWQQIKQQSGNQVIVVESPGGSAVATAPPPAPDAPPATAGSAAGSGGSGQVASKLPGDRGGGGDDDRTPRIIPQDKIADHVRGKVAGQMGKINACVNRYRDTVKDKPTLLKVSLAPERDAKARVEPASVDASPLGRCIQDVVESVTFGKVAKGGTVSVVLKTQ